jgi:hypothetical protein
MSEGTPNAKLLSILAVLRRPQASTDALPTPPSGSWWFGEGVYSKYVRRARVVDGVAYYVVPVAKGWALKCATHEGVVFATAGPEGYGSGGTATAAEIEHGARLEGLFWKDGSGVQSGIVPDGVAKVTLRYPARHHLRATVTVAAVGNVYVTAVPPAARGSETPVLPTTVLWLSAKRHVLKTFHHA